MNSLVEQKPDDELLQLVNKILEMPDHSVIWALKYSISEIEKAINDRLYTERYCSGKKNDFRRGKTVLGKNYTDLIGKIYANEKNGAGVITCPHCFKKDQSDTKFIKHSTIYAGKDLKLVDKHLELLCPNCSKVTVLEPNTVVELGYGNLEVFYCI
ncbi:hypothetical protein GQ472_06910 [archaeon]|nr:hypothetical protein [archaeon]